MAEAIRLARPSDATGNPVNVVWGAGPLPGLPEQGAGYVIPTNSAGTPYTSVGGGLSVAPLRSSTGTSTTVASSATVVTLLAANTARLGATCYNESTVVLYLKLGATASITSYTVQMAASSYYEVPFGYTGIITGLWASATGNARVGELT